MFNVNIRLLGSPLATTPLVTYVKSASW